jgi:hypothetical protein
VFNDIQDHRNWAQNQIKIHPDQQFDQYILPCFVASLLDFADNDDVEQKDKENYVKIVHELIKDSEVHPYKVASPLHGFQSTYLAAKDSLHFVILHWQAELLHRGLQMALGLSSKANKVVEILNKNFVSVLMEFKKIPDFVEKMEEFSFILVQDLWPIQVYRLFGKILNAIEAAVPGSLPNMYSAVLEMTMMAHTSLEEPTFRFRNDTVPTKHFNLGKPMAIIGWMIRARIVGPIGPT